MGLAPAMTKKRIEPTLPIHPTPYPPGPMDCLVSQSHNKRTNALELVFIGVSVCLHFLNIAASGWGEAQARSLIRFPPASPCHPLRRAW